MSPRLCRTTSTSFAETLAERTDHCREEADTYAILLSEHRLMSDAVAAEQFNEFLEKQAIREVTMRYCRGVDRCDAALISSAYHPDAFDDHSGHIFTGETVGEGIVTWMREVLDATTHHITTQTINIEGDTAGCESYYIGMHLETREGVQRRMQTAGRYLDRLEKRNGQWKISSRVVVLESGGYADSLAPGGGVRPTRDANDASYSVIDDRAPSSGRA